MKSTLSYLRVKRKWRRYARGRDVLTFLNGLFAAVLAINAYSISPTVTTVVGMLYVLSLAAFLLVTLRGRKARDELQGQVMWGLFSLINNEIFQGDHRTRYTLFRRETEQSDLISACYRYRKTGRGPIEEADQSRAKYRRHEGVTGEAWAQGGRALLIQVFPEFTNRQEFEGFYINELGKRVDGNPGFRSIRAETVRDLSDYMVDVRTMICYGFVDSSDRTLGVLSLDFKEALAIPGDGTEGVPSFLSPEGEPLVLDAPRLQVLLNSVQNVLESFTQSERRPA